MQAFIDDDDEEEGDSKKEDLAQDETPNQQSIKANSNKGYVVK